MLNRPGIAGKYRYLRLYTWAIADMLDKNGYRNQVLPHYCVHWGEIMFLRSLVRLICANLRNLRLRLVPAILVRVYPCSSVANLHESGRNCPLAPRWGNWPVIGFGTGRFTGLSMLVSIFSSFLLFDLPARRHLFNG